MGKRSSRPSAPPHPPHASRGGARGARGISTSCRGAARPVRDRLRRRLRLAECRRDRLPPDDGRSRVPAATGLLVLVQNLLIARAPLDGVGAWAARHAPPLLGLTPAQLPSLHDDRGGRRLDRLFDADGPSLTRAVVAHAVRAFGVALDDLHHDSTTSTCHGDDEAADHERTRRGTLRRAVTHGHNKDHRPDLKQLLEILTVSRAGAGPVPFRVESGPATDDRSQQGTWKLLCERTGRRDFLYVADCQRAAAANRAPIHQNGGRFLTVRPRTRGADAACRAAGRAGRARWQPIPDQRDDEGIGVDRDSIHEPEATTAEGYRLVGYPSARKAELDALARHQRRERATAARTALPTQLTASRTRYRDRAQVAQAGDTIRRAAAAEGFLVVDIKEQTTATCRQDRRGRPGPDTRSRRSEAPRCELTGRIDHDRLTEESRCDGVFPLVRNVTTMSAPELLLASQPPPMIAQRKTDFVVAPVFLKEVSRIPAWLGVYFCALWVESLRAREWRRARARDRVENLPLDPEGRAGRRPTARRVMDLFEDVPRHELTEGRRAAVVFTTNLTRLQRKTLRLLGMPKADTG